MGATDKATTATVTCEHLRRIVVSVTGPADLEGKPVRLVRMGEAIASGTLTLHQAVTATTLTLPMPPIGSTPEAPDLVVDGKIVGRIDMPDTNRLRLEALHEAPLLFQPSVFTKEQFPPCDFEQPALAEDLVGRYAIGVRFFDRDYNEVTTASAEGRFGAVVEVKGETGTLHRRFLTLCRTLRPVKWRDLELQLGPSSAQALGVSQAFFDAHRERIADYLCWELRGALARSPETASLAAWMIEKRTGRSRVHANPDRVDEKWWYSLKKKLGFLQPYRYLSFLPRDYGTEPRRRFPLILFLHGSGERGLDLEQVQVHGPHKYLLEHPELPFIVIEPQCLPGSWWNPYEVLDMVDEVCAKYRVDTERIYLTGLSMGGFGTWRTIPVAKGRFAAAVPICGGGDVVDAREFLDTPLWVFHGAKDEAVALQRSAEMVRAIRRTGGNVRFTVYPKAGHDSWTETYRNPELYRWLLEQRREGARASGRPGTGR